jgi:5-formyltetrahydrofolate cyclo-ligase
MPNPAIQELKARIRDDAFSRRDALDRGWRAEASLQMADRVLALPELRNLEPVSGFWPIFSEIDPRPLLGALHGRGQRTCLPVVAHPNLQFRLWRPGDELVKSEFGVHQPAPDKAEVFPRALIVPLAAFDRHGGRIGYGKGHFDRAIAALETRHPVLAIGVAFSCQEMPRVPQEAHDMRIDFVATEAEVIRSVPA